ncbi:MAG: hypothetical protein HYX39_07335 [Bacteroidetes bacterium]|nr:hypothetical protein [Bacteroidota bacterium]
MNKLFLVAFVVITSIAAGQKKIKLELTFKYTKPYCGAGKASAAQQADSKKERPLPNQKFFVYQNNTCIDSLITNDSGNVVVKYYPGTYFLFEPWKHFKKTPDNSPITDFFGDCLAKEWIKPNYKVTISDGDLLMIYYEISASRCPNQLACLKVRHLPSQIKRK